MTATRKLGIPTLDRALMDGVPEGFTILVSGNAGSGLELFVKQIAAHGDEPTLFFTTEETASEVQETMKRFDWTKNLQIEDICSRFYDQISKGKLAYLKRRQGDTSVTELLGGADPETEEDFLTSTAQTVMDTDEPRRVVVSKLNFFFEEHEEDDVLSVLRALRTHTRHTGGLVVLSLARGAVDERVVSRLEANVDMVVELEMDRMSSSFEHRIIVKKILNRPDKAQMFVYGVTEDGITPEMVTRVT